MDPADIKAIVSQIRITELEGQTRPWEVKEILLLPRKCPFASERHIRHQAMQKGYKTHSPPLPMGSAVSRSPCILQYVVFLFSFLQLNSLQIKSF
jgi:hypothetical protein